MLLHMDLLSQSLFHFLGVVSLCYLYMTKFKPWLSSMFGFLNLYKSYDFKQILIQNYLDLFSDLSKDLRKTCYFAVDDRRYVFPLLSLRHFCLVEFLIASLSISIFRFACFCIYVVSSFYFFFFFKLHTQGLIYLHMQSG